MLWNEEHTPVESRLSTGGFLSWTFRGFETYVLVVALGPILDSLISPTAESAFALYAGIALGATLLGWAIGGVVRGLTVRFVGRRNTAIYSVLGYTILTGVTALSGTFLTFIALRFLTGVLLGTEGERGTLFLSKFHPDDRRAHGAGSVHAGFGVGIVLASAAWFALQSFDLHVFSNVLGTESWRYLFALGVIPAVFALYLRRTAAPSTDEMDAVQEPTDDADSETTNTGDESTTSVSGLFGEASLRRRTVVSVILSFVATAGLWGITAWIPLFAGDIAVGAGVPHPDHWGAIAGVCYGLGAIVGYAAAEPIADRIGQLGSLMVMLLGSFATVPVLYLVIRTPYLLLVLTGLAGFFTLGLFGWLHVHLSELFPDSVRGTALGTVYILARLLAFVVPVLAGFEVMTFETITTVVATFGILYGLGIFAALFLPPEIERPTDSTHSS